MTNVIDPVVVANAERDEARRAADAQAAEIARLRAQVEAYERQVVAVRVDRAEAIGLTRVTADEARAVAARYDELAGEILKLGTQLEATLADLSQARGELEDERQTLASVRYTRDMAVEQRDAAIKHAERLGEENARLKAEDERATEHLREMLRKVDEEQNGVAICSWCALPTNSDEASKRTHQMTCPKSPIVALLGHAVAALQMVKANRACSSNTCATIVDAILADSTATAAVDAYRAQREEREELEAVYEAARRERDAYAHEPAYAEALRDLRIATAKVDARRGGR